MPQLDSSSFISQIFWLVISFSFLYFAISKYTVPAVSKILELRNNNLQSNLKEAETLSQMFEKINLECENALKEARKKASLALMEAEFNLKLISEKTLNELDIELSNKAKEASFELESVKKQLLLEMTIIEDELTEQIFNKITKEV
jgi:F-type H+-transporting ATPase subunit b